MKMVRVIELEGKISNENANYEIRALRSGIVRPPTTFREFSALHLLLNPSNRFILPQYHVSFDNLFQTSNNMHVVSIGKSNIKLCGQNHLKKYGPTQQLKTKTL